MTALQGIVFDKDGTLFDFNATWGAWSRAMLVQEARDDADMLNALADALGYDLTHGVFRPGSIVIAETSLVVAQAIASITGDRDHAALQKRMDQMTAKVAQVPVAPLAPLFRRLRAMNLALGIATNDSEAPARAHLAKAGVTDLFDFIAGCDSGFGGKPATGQLDAFCAQTGLDPAACAMVGDSLHDLHAGRAAGMCCVGVLTGPALRAELAPTADVVLASIADLPDWISSQG